MKLYLTKLLYVPLLILALTFVLSHKALASEPQENAAEARDPNLCFEQKDVQCLEELYSDIVTNPSKEKAKAMYLLGLIKFEQEDYETAKDQFMMSMAFGGDPKPAHEKLRELYEENLIEFSSSDCLSIESQDCLIALTATDSDQTSIAHYHLARLLAEKDSESSNQHLLSAAKGGHTTAACLLSSGYAQEEAYGPSVLAGFTPKFDKDYAKSRKWGVECGSGPFKGYNEKHFKRYEAQGEHKAYAIFGKNYRTYESGAATPEIAASLAGTLCDMGSKRGEGDKDCLVINVDGEWVDYFPSQPLPEPVGEIEDLLHAKARTAFTEGYSKKGAPKVFVQGPLGNWAWTSRSSDVPLEEVTEIALKSCNNSWRQKKFGSKCIVVNINGEWVK